MSTRFEIRLTPDDLHAIDLIRDHVRASNPWADRAAVVRHALKTTAEALRDSTGRAAASLPPSTFPEHLQRSSDSQRSSQGHPAATARSHLPDPAYSRDRLAAALTGGRG